MDPVELALDANAVKFVAGKQSPFPIQSHGHHLALLLTFGILSLAACMTLLLYDYVITFDEEVLVFS